MFRRSDTCRLVASAVDFIKGLNGSTRWNSAKVAISLLKLGFTGQLQLCSKLLVQRKRGQESAIWHFALWGAARVKIRACISNHIAGFVIMSVSYNIARRLQCHCIV